MTVLYYVTDNSIFGGLKDSLYKFMIFDNLEAAKKRAYNINSREQDNIAKINEISLKFQPRDKHVWVLCLNKTYEFFDTMDLACFKRDMYIEQGKKVCLQKIHIDSSFTVWHAHS